MVGPGRHQTDWGTPQAEGTLAGAQELRWVGDAGGGAWTGPAEQFGRRTSELHMVILALLVPAVASATWLTLTGHQSDYPAVRAAFLAFSIAVPVAVGLLWWRRRPASAFGPLLVVFGFLAWPLSLQSTADPIAFSLGVAAQAPYAFLIFYLALAYPTGRLTSRFERRLMAAWGVILSISSLALISVLPHLDAFATLLRCSPTCPVSPFQFGAAPAGVIHGLFVVLTGATIMCAMAIVGTQAVRFQRSSFLQRRADAPVLLATLLLLVTFVAFYSTRALPVSEAADAVSTWLFVASRICFPLAFLVALLYADTLAGGVYLRLAEALSSVKSPSAIRDALAAALHDPQLRLGLWDRESGRYVEHHGATLPAGDGPGRVVVPVSNGFEAMGYIVTDEILVEAPEVLEAASAATIVAVQDELAEEEAMALRAEVVSATDSERRRIVRDLHDGAQQRLVALRVKVGLAADRPNASPEDQAEMRRFGNELDVAIEELRGLVRSYLTPELAGRGISVALRSVTRAWPMDVSIRERGIGRYGGEIESTVFNCCLEALHNARAYAGDEANVSVSLFERNGRIVFVVRDNGNGFDPDTTQYGQGLTGIADRAVLAGGCVTVNASPGKGVVVRGRIPIAAATT